MNNIKTRLYKNKNYWIRQATKQNRKLPSERFLELMQNNQYETIKREIPKIENILKKLK